ncbi:MAG: Rieske (2Fe-2S) protein [Humibacillus sp.]|nr:Rieske (2Fe-2S) protein [Humibacillus sp.]MDN5775961.1 Rieske (2Fe-2S) protein [Humibacillus sp.]
MTRFQHPSPSTPSPRPEGGTRATPEDAADLRISGIRPLTDRRGVLKAVGLGVGVATGAGVLAACSSPSVQPDPSANDPAGSGDGTPASGAAASGGTPTSEIPVGGGTIFTATMTVVTQPQTGTLKAFDTTCPHQGCAVAQVASGTIDCPCHGSQFDITTGQPVTGPAVTGLTPKTITVTGDTFTVA